MSNRPSNRTVEDLRAERLGALNLMEDAIASREYAESIVETLHEPLLVLHPDLTVRSVNPAFYTHFQVTPADTIGQRIYDLGNGQWNIPALRALLEDVLPDSKVFNDHEVTHEFETIGRRVMLLNGRRLDHVQLILLGIRDITERKRAEEALRESEARLQKAISIRTVAVLFFHLDGRLIDANAAFVRMSGYSVEQLRKMKYFEQLTAPEFLDVTRRTAKQLAETGETPPYEKQMVRPDGSRWWGLFAPTRLSGTGKRSECVEFIVDISEQKTYEAELSESEERYRSIVNQNVAGILQIDVHGSVLFANQQFCLAMDRTRDELRQLTVRDLVHPDDYPESLRRLKKMARDGKPFEMEKRLLRADGTAFWVHNAITPITSPDGKVRLATIVSLDINARCEAEAQLRANEEQFRRAIEDAPIPVIMHAEDGQVLQISRTWTELTGYKAEDIPTFQAWLKRACGSGAYKVRHRVQRLFRGRTRQLGFEMDVTTRQGAKRRWAFSASTPGTLRDGRRYIVGMAVDVTERVEKLREANTELRELSRRLVAAQETERRKIAEKLHDDIGQMLTGLNLVLKRARKVSNAKELTQAELLVADLLERVRGLSMELRPHILDNLGLTVALRWHVKKFAEQTKIPVTLRLRQIRNDLPSDVATTAFRLVQEALTNVARHSGARRARVSMHGRHNGLEIEVHDDGRGFDPKRLPADSSGLANLRERVRLSGGEFTITSGRHTGSTLRAALPVSPCAAS